jgi:HAD superfamily hydrolase (TIGR01509 family)
MENVPAADGLLAVLDRGGPPGPPPPAAPGSVMAVLVDLDGTLANSEGLGDMTDRAVQERLGSVLTATQQEEMLGCSPARTVEILLASAEEPMEPADAEELLITTMLQLVAQHGVPLRPGARELLDAIKKYGLPHALVTSSGLRVADAVLTSTRMTFPVVVSGDDVAAAKPGPEPYRQAAALLGIPPARCVAIEDSRAGVASARAAKIGQVIAVPSEGVTISPAPGLTIVRSLCDLQVGPGGVTVRSC